MCNIWIKDVSTNREKINLSMIMTKLEKLFTYLKKKE